MQPALQLQPSGAKYAHRILTVARLSAAKASTTPSYLGFHTSLALRLDHEHTDLRPYELDVVSHPSSTPHLRIRTLTQTNPGPPKATSVTTAICPSQPEVGRERCRKVAAPAGSSVMVQCFTAVDGDAVLRAAYASNSQYRSVLQGAVLCY